LLDFKFSFYFHPINQKTAAEYSDREGKTARLSNFFAFMIKPTLKWQK